NLNDAGEYLTSVRLDDEYQHKKIGTQLLDYIEQDIGHKLKHSPTYETPAGAALMNSRKETEQPVIKLSNAGDKEANKKKLKPFFTDFLKAGMRNPLDDRELIIGKAGVELAMTIEGNVHLNFIRSLEQGGGHARKAPDKVCELAD